MHVEVFKFGDGEWMGEQKREGVSKKEKGRTNSTMENLLSAYKTFSINLTIRFLERKKRYHTRTHVMTYCGGCE